jgi:hypothetical protein
LFYIDIGLGKLLIYKRKNRGPKVKPCDTPYLINFSDVIDPFIWHFWLQEDLSEPI